VRGLSLRAERSNLAGSIMGRVLSPHHPDVLVGADLRVRPEEGNHAGLPLQRNCPGPMRRHPLQPLRETVPDGNFARIIVSKEE